MMTTFKTVAAAAVFATVGVAAQAATVAQLTVTGLSSEIEDANGTVIGRSADAEFTAFLDSTFDPTVTQDFLFELDLALEDIPVIDEEIQIDDITGDDILAFATGLLTDIDLTLPGVLGSILVEAQDTNGEQSELGATGLFLSLDFFTFNIVPNGANGIFSFVLADSTVDFSTASLTNTVFFEGSATISTVSAVPLPATLPLLAFGGAGLMALGRRRKAAA